MDKQKMIKIDWYKFRNDYMFFGWCYLPWLKPYWHRSDIKIFRRTFKIKLARADYYYN